MNTVQKISRLRQIWTIMKRQHARISNAEQQRQDLIRECTKIIRTIPVKDKELYSEQIRKYGAF